MDNHFPRFAENCKPYRTASFQRIAQFARNQGDTISPMDYKNEIGVRIRKARLELGLTLQQLEPLTPGLTFKRINAYENGDRMPGPSEAVILAKALRKKAAWIMALDDVQLPITPQEEKLVKNWRTLPERERMEFFRQVEALAMTHRDPVADLIVERHLPKPYKTGTAKVAATRRIKKESSRQ